MNLIAKQKEICSSAGSGFTLPNASDVVGFAMVTKELDQPLHGLRRAPEEHTAGWYLWRGEFSEADDFFAPLHVSCLEKHCYDAMEFLALSPGWRFLSKGSYRDVWYVKALLTTPENEAIPS